MNRVVFGFLSCALLFSGVRVSHAQEAPLFGSPKSKFQLSVGSSFSMGRVEHENAWGGNFRTGISYLGVHSVGWTLEYSLSGHAVQCLADAACYDDLLQFQHFVTTGPLWYFSRYGFVQANIGFVLARPVGYVDDVPTVFTVAYGGATGVVAPISQRTGLRFEVRLNSFRNDGISVWLISTGITFDFHW